MLPFALPREPSKQMHSPPQPASRLVFWFYASNALPFNKPDPSIYIRCCDTASRSTSNLKSKYGGSK